MTYLKLQPGDPGYTRVSALKAAGEDVCDAVDHNDDTGCSNPDCFNFTARALINPGLPTEQEYTPCTCHMSMMGFGAPPEQPCPRHGVPAQLGKPGLAKCAAPKDWQECSLTEFIQVLKNQFEALQATCAKQGSKLARIEAALEKARGAPLGLPSPYKCTTQIEHTIIDILREKGSNRG